MKKEKDPQKEQKEHQKSYKHGKECRETHMCMRYINIESRIYIYIYIYILVIDTKFLLCFSFKLFF